MQTEPVVIRAISAAHYNFDLNMLDVKSLLEKHGKGGYKPGRRFGLDPLNKIL